MAHNDIKPGLSVTQRLWTIGGAATAGILTIIAVGIYENGIVAETLGKAEAMRQQVEEVVAMRHANMTMVLAAMDTIVDRNERKVQPERAKAIAEAAKTLREGSKALQTLAATLGETAAAARFPADLESLTKAISVDLTALVENGGSEEAYGTIDNAIDTSGEAMGDILAGLAAEGGLAVRDRLAAADSASGSSLYLQLAAGLGALGLTLVMQIFHGNSLSRGIRAVSASMQRILDGDIDTTVMMAERGDEIGEMARATDRFRMAVAEKAALEAQAADTRQMLERDRISIEQTRQADEQAVRFAVDALGAGLNRLASGDISTTIDTPFRPDLERLREDFNTTTAELQAVVGDIRTNSVAIQANSQQMREAAEDLAKRTEQQAASLEETSAALDQITTRVRTSADRAKEAGKMVEGTRLTSERSGKVVADAMSAMGRIEDASREIGQIINVIDEIAFQTNLLALNAGVEAARAGQAGKGFAVVAQEVRELAGRAAGAAKDIKTLIGKSSGEVRNGVEMVTATGEVLRHIGEDVVSISEHFVSILSDAQEQQTGLTEINAAVVQMDKVTQQNAAMVEETSAASHTLARGADTLIQAISRFKLRERNPEYTVPQATKQAMRLQHSPARALAN